MTSLARFLLRRLLGIAVLIWAALLTAVTQGDLMVVMGTVLVTVILISLVNLIADICQAVLDPRVQVIP